MTPPILRQLRHDIWATERLITHLRGLDESALALTVPGTYGDVRRTLMHIVAGCRRYLIRLGAASGPALDQTGPDLSLDEVARHLDDVKGDVERLFAGTEFDPDRWLDDPLRPGQTMQAWLLVTQFAHHGSDHRAQIGTILGAHGLPTPDLDVWAYARELGALREKRSG